MHANNNLVLGRSLKSRCVIVKIEIHFFPYRETRLRMFACFAVYTWLVWIASQIKISLVEYYHNIGFIYPVAVIPGINILDPRRTRHKNVRGGHRESRGDALDDISRHNVEIKLLETAFIATSSFLCRVMDFFKKFINQTGIEKVWRK